MFPSFKVVFQKRLIALKQMRSMREVQNFQNNKIGKAQTFLVCVIQQKVRYRTTIVCHWL